MKRHGAWMAAALVVTVLGAPVGHASERSKDSDSHKSQKHHRSGRSSHDEKHAANEPDASKPRPVVHALKGASEHELEAAKEERAAATAEDRAAKAEKEKHAGTGGSGAVAAKEAEAARKTSQATHEDVKALTDEVQALQGQVEQLRDQLSKRSELACETGTEKLSERRDLTPAIVGESHGTGHVWGKVEAAENDRLYIRGPSDDLFPVYVNEDTDARKEKHDVSIGEVKVGDTVDVAVESHQGDLIARDVTIVPEKEKDEREKADEHRELEKERALQEQKAPQFDAHQD